jgi:hypothetical protein
MKLDIIGGGTHWSKMKLDIVGQDNWRKYET